MAGYIDLGAKSLLISVLISNLSLPSQNSINLAWEDLNNYITGLESISSRAQLLIMSDFNMISGPNNNFSGWVGAADNKIFAFSYDRISEDLW